MDKYVAERSVGVSCSLTRQNPRLMVSLSNHGPNTRDQRRETSKAREGPAFFTQIDPPDRFARKRSFELRQAHYEVFWKAPVRQIAALVHRGNHALDQLLEGEPPHVFADRCRFCKTLFVTMPLQKMRL